MYDFEYVRPLSSIPTLRGSRNYFEWSKAIDTFLRLHGLRRVLSEHFTEPYSTNGNNQRTERTGAGARPTKDPSTGADLTAEEIMLWSEWAAEEDRVQGILISTCAAVPQSSIIDMFDAKSMWTYLETTYNIKTKEMQGEILASLSMLRLKNNPTSKDMDKHLDNFALICARLRAAGGSISDTQKLVVFLGGLPSSMMSLKETLADMPDSDQTWMTVLKLWDNRVDIMRREERKSRGFK